MRSSETLPANAPPQTSIQRLRRDEKRSRCSLPTSNASSAWDGSDYGAHAAFKTSLPSQPPPKTSGNWQSSSRWHQPQVKAAATPLTSERNQTDTSNRRTEISDFFNRIGGKLSFSARAKNLDGNGD